ncbi:hypothetical protein AB8B02_06085 [Tardiphaga sp. 862_B3_N4_1]|uniref:hypothetical protein n=1 Tax=Tardiphaga sp. 862_B3_N4_1 TaxID=3240764 RepID=UPI003F293B75
MAIVVALGSLIVAFALFGSQIREAGWGVIDDHEVFLFLGKNEHLRFSEIFTTILTKTEIGSLVGRFRPSYYFLRISETVVWGRHVHLWYVSHAVAFAVFLAAIWWSVSRFLGLVPAALSMLPIVCTNFWGAIWGRLGPSEIYAAPAMGLVLAGSVVMFFSSMTRRSNWSVVLLTVGIIVAIGSKETLLPLAGIAVLVIALAARLGRIGRISATLSLTIIVLFTVVIVAVASFQMLSVGTDIYANPISLTGRLAAVLAVTPIWVFAACSTIPVVALVTYSASKPSPALPTLGVAGGLCFLIALYVSQQVAYGGTLPTGTRYDFPAMLIPTWIAIYVGCVVVFWTRQVRVWAGNILAMCLGLAVAGASVTYGAMDDLALSMAAVDKNISGTQKFSSELARVLAAARANPSTPIVLEVHGSGAFEPVYSLERYFIAEHVANKVAVRFRPMGTGNNSLHNMLDTMLIGLQEKGDHFFVPLLSIPADAPCLSVGLNGEGDERCEKFRINS